MTNPHVVTGRDLEFTERLVRCQTDAGTIYMRRVGIGMPRIPQNTANCVVFLYWSKNDALTGRDPQGTGFVVGVPSSVNPNPSQNHYYVISNRHVTVSPVGTSPPAPVVSLNLLSGGVDPIDLDSNFDWQFEPGGDDVAIAAIELDASKHKFSYIPLNEFADEKWVDDRKIGFGDDVFMLGLFLDEEGIATRLPKARFGNISAMPSQHTQIEQKTGSRRPSIVIDMHSRGGHSGSPVFVYRLQGANLDAANTNDVAIQAGALSSTLFKFFGVHWGQFPETLELKSGEEVEGWSGMTCAIPAWRLVVLFNLPKIEEHRMKREEEQAKNPAIRNAPRVERAPPANDANPKHREDFTRLLGEAARKREQED